jgi:hypothetical protein
VSAIFAIDPGSERSAWLMYDPRTSLVRGFEKVVNDVLLEHLRSGVHVADVDVVAIEQIEPRYGLNPGWETLDTARWVGRFEEAAHPTRVARLTRSDILRHLGVVTRGPNRTTADAGVRAALIDRFGGTGGKTAAIGLKATPGPLYGISQDVWAALSVAVTFADQEAAR